MNKQQEFEKDILARRSRSAALEWLQKDPAFLDAVAGIKLLHKWDGEAMIERAAFDGEIQRACRAANSQAALVGIERSHENWEDANRGLTDGTVIRHLMARAEIVGDWFFVPAMKAASLESFAICE